MKPKLKDKSFYPAYLYSYFLITILQKQLTSVLACADATCKRSEVLSRITMVSWLSSTQVENLKKQLKIDEGVVYKIYIDSLGFRTFGIGHLIKPSDPENKLATGTSVSEVRVNEAFIEDLTEAISSTASIFPSCATWPNEVQEIIVNMTFNLGGKMKLFKNLAKALEKRNWCAAADEMKNSKWYVQVKSRAERLVVRMRNVKEK